MADTPATVLLRHGTTRERAVRVLAVGPDANHIEPGGDAYSRAAGFSTVVAGAPTGALGAPEHYARAKAANFPNEGGPVILEVEVPGWIVDILCADPFAAAVVASGEVRFEPDLGLPELQREWPTLNKRIVPV
jgi:hypothetical protein